MDKDTIIEYIKKTPANTNPAVLGSMVDSVSGSDLPPIESGDAGKVLTVNDGETGAEWAAASGGIDQFIKQGGTLAEITETASKVVTQQGHNKYQVQWLPFDDLTGGFANEQIPIYIDSNIAGYILPPVDTMADISNLTIELTQYATEHEYLISIVPVETTVDIYVFSESENPPAQITVHVPDVQLYVASDLFTAIYHSVQE